MATLTAATLAVCPAWATTIHVPADQPTIQAGIDAASAGDTVLVACGTYYEHDISMKSGVCLTSESGFADCVTVDAESAGRVVSMLHVDQSTTICGFTFVNGRTDSLGRGGGMYCLYSSPRIENVVVRDNVAGEGGGVFCSESSPQLVEVEFVSNSAVAGGGMFCNGSSAPTLTDVAFRGNRAIGGSGGGMSCRWWASPVLSGVVFEGNQAGQRGGGAILNNTWRPVLDGVEFTANTAEWRGGGLFCSSTQAVVTNTVFLGNTAGMGGGAIHCMGGDVSSFSSCVLSGNSAPDGGGLSCSWGSSPSLENTTLFGNAAVGSGGGIYLWSSCSIALENVIVAAGGGGAAVVCEPQASAALSCCDVHGNLGGDWIGCLASQSGTNGNIALDPLFCLDENPLEPLTLYSNSPCSADSNQQCGQIGALGVGCEEVLVEGVSWGVLKALFQ